jgi:hypothetical protein
MTWLVLFAGRAVCDVFYATGRINAAGEVTVIRDKIDKTGDCWVTFDEAINKTGWYVLSMEGREGLAGPLMGKCVGYLEGVLTQHRFYQALSLFKDAVNVKRDAHFKAKLIAFYKDHLRWIEQSIAAYPDDLYWRQVSVLQSMFEGMYAGYTKTAPPEEIVDYHDFYAYVAMGDTMELNSVVNAVRKYDVYGPTVEKYEDVELILRCTGMIKLTPNRDDIYFAHDSWTDYRALHSVIKNYNLPCPEFKNKSPRVSLSTTLGLISSVDDFFINEKGLMIFETTFTLQNWTLFTNYLTAKSVMNWMRTILAAFTADNVHEWDDQFLRHNSGTYNNEYYVVDTKLLRENRRVEKDLVHAVTQIPGPWRWIQDVTD